MKTWLRHHVSAMRSAWAHVLAAPGNFALNMLVVAITLMVPFAGLTALDNLRPISSELVVQPEITVFMAVTTPRERATALGQEIAKTVSKVDSGARIAFVPRETALSSLEDRTGLSGALATLETNPLPDAYVITLTPFERPADASKSDRLVKALGALDDVDLAQIDSDWVKRLAALLQLAHMLLLLLALTLSVVVVAVIFNTIRLQVVTQHEEIEVARLVGATDAFIRRPFYYTGALLGLLSGALALIAVAALLRPVNRAVAEFAHLYASDFVLTLPTSPVLFGLLTVSSLLGLAGAALSVRRHLVSSA
jgi:cell division transport system permease protein